MSDDLKETNSWEVLSTEIEDVRLRLGVQIQFVSGTVARLQHGVLRRFADRGITSRDDYWTMALIRRVGERGVSITELAVAMDVTTGTISNRIERLHNEGHLARIPHERDRRSHRVVFTADGEKLIDEMVQAMTAVHQECLSALSESQCDELSKLLDLCMD
ncbi:MAG: MarR family transcriptional regulator [Acidimicrobiaceae bacterium]|nr:MarR family transcriptional regulator [Acidimicrobiaceae bacterium]